MSANRSVQAAQRRRAGPTSEAMPGRAGPQPSINSAQVFANQARSGPGPNIPNGRLAGQQAQMQQKQQMQQQQQQMQQKPEGVGGVSKMTIAQAITLITLRLGAIETKIIQIEHEPQLSGHGLSNDGLSNDGQDNMVLIDKTVIQSITSRIESLEKRSLGPASNSGPEVALLKQNFETVKQAVIQTKGVVTTISKENKELKTQVDNLKNDLTETRELLAALQNLTMDNSQKLLDFSVNMSQTFDHDRLGEDGFGNGEEEGEGEGEGEEEYEYEASLNQLRFNEIDPNEIIGTNLKELIESEINANS
jgi:hypothetical protein